MSEWRPEIEGWSSDILPFYAAMSDKLPDGALIAEVGVYKGRSLLYFAEQLAARRKLACRIDAIDSWEASWCPNMWEMFQGHLRDSSDEVRSMITCWRMSSADAARMQNDQTLDFCFIDADHNYESVRSDIAAWLPKVRPGGIICGHDYSGDLYGSFPGVDRAVHEAFAKDRVQKPSGSVWLVQL